MARALKPLRLEIRTGLLRDIMFVLAGEKVNITAAHTQSTRQENTATMLFTIEIGSLDLLGRILGRRGLMPNPKGDTLPIDILMDRIDGKPVQKVELKGNQPHSFDEIPTDMIMGMLAGTVEIPEHLLSLGESGSGKESDTDA